MKRLGLYFMILHLTLQAAWGEPRFALVQFEEITKELAAFRMANDRMKEELEKLPQHSSNVQLQKAMGELNGLLKQLDGLPTGPNRKAKVDLALKAESLRQEVESLRKAFSQYEEREVKRIKTETLAAILALHEKVKAAAVSVAEERGFDCLFEIKGNSNTSVPVLIYAKNPIDITGDVLAKLKAEEPPAPDKPETAPAPAPATAPKSPAPAPTSR